NDRSRRRLTREARILSRGASVGYVRPRIGPRPAIPVAAAGGAPMERLPGRVRVANKFFVAWLFLTIICFCGFCLMIRPKGQRGLGIVKKLSPMSARLGGGRRHLAVYFDDHVQAGVVFR